MASGGEAIIRRLAFDQAPVALSLIDLDARQVTANEAYLAMFGLARDTLTDVTPLAITHPSDRERTRDYLSQLARGEIDHVVVEKRYVRSDGREFDGRLEARPLHDDNGRVIAILGAIRDLTEQEAFDRMAREFDVRESVERVAAETAHELNNLLAAMMLQLDLTPAGVDGTLRGLIDRAARLGADLVALSGDEVRTSIDGDAAGATGVARPAVLVVDDEPTLLDSVGQALRRSGFEVHLATGAEEALHLAPTVSFGVLVTDIAMPDIDGVTLAERLRAERPGLPVLFITGHATHEVARRLPADAAILRKPFRALDLVSSVARLVPAGA